MKFLIPILVALVLFGCSKDDTCQCNHPVADNFAQLSSGNRLPCSIGVSQKDAEEQCSNPCIFTGKVFFYLVDTTGWGPGISLSKGFGCSPSTFYAKYYCFEMLPELMNTPGVTPDCNDFSSCLAEFTSYSVEAEIQNGEVIGYYFKESLSFYDSNDNSIPLDIKVYVWKKGNSNASMCNSIRIDA